MFYAPKALYPGDLISERRHCLKDSKPSFFGVIYKQSQEFIRKVSKNIKGLTNLKRTLQIFRY